MWNTLSRLVCPRNLNRASDRAIKKLQNRHKTKKFEAVKKKVFKAFLWEKSWKMLFFAQFPSFLCAIYTDLVKINIIFGISMDNWVELHVFRIYYWTFFFIRKFAPWSPSGFASKKIFFMEPLFLLFGHQLFRALLSFHSHRTCFPFSK